VLVHVAGTLLPLLAAVLALQLWVPESGVGTWPAAGAVVAGWAAAVAGWLRVRGWRAGAVLAAVGAPAAVLAGSAVIGWLSPAGLVLWGPVSTLLAVAQVVPARPAAPVGPTPDRCPASGRPASERPADRPEHPRSSR
jgi:hypothetical protein